MAELCNTNKKSVLPVVKKNFKKSVSSGKNVSKEVPKISIKKNLHPLPVLQANGWIRDCCSEEGKVFFWNMTTNENCRDKPVVSDNDLWFESVDQETGKKIWTNAEDGEVVSVCPKSDYVEHTDIADKKYNGQNFLADVVWSSDPTNEEDSD